MKNPSCLVLLVGALLSACEPATPPPPSVLSIEPAQLAPGQSAELRLRIDAVLPGTMNYGSRSVAGGDLDSAVQVWVGEVRVPVDRYEEGGFLVVRVPAGLTVGEHDVRLVLSDGREGALSRALTVRSAHEAEVQQPGSGSDPDSNDAGVPARDAGNDDDDDDDDDEDGDERQGLSGFTIDSLEDQVRNEPFTLTLRAQGSQAVSFKGMVTLRSSKGTITPSTVGPFVDGVLSVQVTLSQPSPQYIIAEDEHGNTGQSNQFMVRPN